METHAEHEPDEAAGGAEGHEPAEHAAAVSVAALAERVLRLMRDEVRLERARGAGLFERRR